MKTFLIAIWGLLSFVLVEVVVFLPIYLLGLVLMPALCNWAPIEKRESRLNPGVEIEAFRWAWAQALFGNWEDGLSPTWWNDYNLVPAPTAASRFTWFLRNPVNNMRFWPWISTRPAPARVGFIGMDHIPAAGEPGWFLCWQGLAVGCRWQCASWGIWAGWAVSPSDRLGMPNDWRAAGYSVVLQLFRF